MSELDPKIRVIRFIWSSFPWIIVLAVIAFIAVMVVQIGGKGAQLEKERLAAVKGVTPATKVITLTLEGTRLEDKINLPGQVEPQEELWIKAEAFGQVTRTLVDDGQKVRKGQLLLELDDRDYRERLARIEASYNLVKQDYDRYAALAEKRIAARNQLEEIEARLKQATAQRNEAKLALSRTRIVAPIDGHLNRIEPVEGDLLSVGDRVAQLLDVGNVKVTVGVPESDVSAFHDLEESTVVIEALENRRVTGKKLFLSYQPRGLARLYDLELLVANPDGRIRPGMFARVELVKRAFENALVIPLYAVITQGDEKYVFIENDSHAKKRPVTIGILTGWKTQVTSGLNPGDRVIIVGQRFLDDGQALEVVKNVSNAEEILEP